MRRFALAIAATLLVAAAGQPATTPRDGLTLSGRADPALVARAVEDAHVDTRPPEPALTVWLQAVLERAVSAALDLLRFAPASRRLIGYAASALAVTAVAVALAMLAVATLRWWRLRRRAPATGGDGSVAGGGAASPAGMTAQGLWAAVERALAAGCPAEAVAALWWWLATVLLGAAVDPSWTSRQLVERSGRRDLRRLVGRLDALAYGPATVDTGSVRRLADDLKGVVG